MEKGGLFRRMGYAGGWAVQEGGLCRRVGCTKGLTIKEGGLSSVHAHIWGVGT